MDSNVPEDLTPDQQLVEIVTSLIPDGSESAVYVSGLGAFSTAVTARRALGEGDKIEGVFLLAGRRAVGWDAIKQKLSTRPLANHSDVDTRTVLDVAERFQNDPLAKALGDAYLYAERYLRPLEQGLFESSAEELDLGDFSFIPNQITVRKDGVLNSTQGPIANVTITYELRSDGTYNVIVDDGTDKMTITFDVFEDNLGIRVPSLRRCSIRTRNLRMNRNGGHDTETWMAGRPSQIKTASDIYKETFEGRDPGECFEWLDQRTYGPDSDLYTGFQSKVLHLVGLLR